MARVTVEDCIDKIPNRYELLMVAAQRAKDISAGAPLTLPRDNDKNPVVALREIAAETVSIEDLQKSLVMGLQKYVEVEEPEEEELEIMAAEKELVDPLVDGIYGDIHIPLIHLGLCPKASPGGTDIPAIPDGLVEIEDHSVLVFAHCRDFDAVKPHGCEVDWNLRHVRLVGRLRREIELRQITSPRIGQVVVPGLLYQSVLTDEWIVVLRLAVALLHRELRPAGTVAGDGKDECRDHGFHIIQLLHSEMSVHSTAKCSQSCLAEMTNDVNIW